MGSMAGVGIGAITWEIPETRIDNRARAESLAASEELLTDKIGVLRIAQKSPDIETSDMAVAAVRRLFESGAATPDEIECLVLVTQNPDGHGLPQCSAIVHGKLGLPTTCAAFDVSLGCSGYVYGLSVAISFMEANGMKRGLLVTADPYSKIIDMQDRNTSLLFGDAATATLLTDQPVWKMGRCDFGTQGASANELIVRDDGKLYMNGRAVFNFTAKVVPDSIMRALQINNTRLEDVDRFVLHQGSRKIVQFIGERMNVLEYTPFCAGDYGNTASSSIPLVLARDLEPTDRVVLISGFGVGLSWASTVLRRS